MASFVFIWAVLAAGYLLFAGHATAEEATAAALCGLIAALWSLVIRRVAPQHFRFHGTSAAASLAAAAKLPAAAVRVALALLRATASGRGGWISSEPFSFGRETAPADIARRAVVVLARSLAPDNYVVRAPKGRDELVVHFLVPSSHSRDPRWPV
ncbi:MAG: hypothetical protein ACREHV_01410 [Rhizomicrobium sp.]